ncbi:MAG: hypothetical protein ACK4ND_18630, partial [Cytophagaceae bacterium]
FLSRKVEEHNLCAKLCGLQKTMEACMDLDAGVCKGACIKDESRKSYNIRVAEAIESFTDSRKTFIIKGQGRSEDEYSIIMVEAGKYLGYGFVPTENALNSFQDMKIYINGQYDNQDVQKIIESYLRAGNEESVIYFSESKHITKVRPTPVPVFSAQQSLF